MKRTKSVKTKKKKLGNRIVLGAVMAMLLQATVVPALASNYHDTPFEFDFEDGTWQTTPERAKEDDSCVYMFCHWSESDGDSYKAYVWGWSPSDGIEMRTDNGPYYFSEGTICYMTNWVYENDLEYAYVKARQTGDGIGHFTGVWSPDSI